MDAGKNGQLEKVDAVARMETGKDGPSTKTDKLRRCMTLGKNGQIEKVDAVARMETGNDGWTLAKMDHRKRRTN